MDYIYKTYFKLSADVGDFGEACVYLCEDDMTRYLITDEVSDTCRSDIKNIKWVLTDPRSGYIALTTTRELSSDELLKISEWVSGQNSDGLGEGFEQQDFAYNEATDTVADFDWLTNSYIFELVEKL